MTRKTLIAATLFCALTTNAQDITPYIPGVTAEGIVYYLPKTELEVTVAATMKSFQPGELCQYAERYLRLQDASSMPEQTWEINTIEVTPVGVPNPELAFAIKLKDKSAASQVELTDDGIIKAINTTSPQEKKTEKAPFVPVQRKDPRSYMTEEMLMTGSSANLAELVAKEIYSIRESRNSLTRGQADYMPEDGNALKLMLTQLEEQEKALTELFTGYTEISEQTFTYRVTPSEDLDKEVLFRFSTKLGIMNKKNLAGDPVYISITQEKSLPTAEEGKKGKKKPNGVTYNIPVNAQVIIQMGTKKYYEGKIPFAQFGTTEILTYELFNKKNNTRVIFEPTTGGIVKIDKD